MASPAVDLPDPLQASPAEAAQNADDLLAQLAGDEIDRLLAEADVEAKPNGRRETPAAVPEAESLAPPPAVTEVVEEAAPALPASEPPPPADPQTVEETAAVLPPEALEPVADSLPAAEASPTVGPTAGPTADPGRAEWLAAELDADAGHNPLAAPAEEAPSADGAATEPAAAQPASLPEILDEVLATPAEEPRPSVLLRPLYWLNRPFASLSDETRSLIGKIAILTLLNALAILAYVLYLRR